MKVSEKLIKRLRREFPDFNDDVPEIEKPRRLYHGYHQRSMGAWSWCIGGNSNTNVSYGSQWSMGELLKSKNLSLYKEHGSEWAILPE